jgi:hypothetical protein
MPLLLGVVASTIKYCAVIIIVIVAATSVVAVVVRRTGLRGAVEVDMTDFAGPWTVCLTCVTGRDFSRMHMQAHESDSMESGPYDE